MKLQKEKVERPVFKEKQRITEQLQLSTAQCSTDLQSCFVGARDGKFWYHHFLCVRTTKN